MLSARKDVIDVMDRYDWNVTYAGVTDSVEVCDPFAAPRGGMSVEVDTRLSEITDFDGYDAIVLLAAGSRPAGGDFYCITISYRN